MDGRESAVFTSETVDVEATRRWRKGRSVLTYHWHLIRSEQPRTWCGLDISYTEPRRPWGEIPDDQRCQTCGERFARVTPAAMVRPRGPG